MPLNLYQPNHIELDPERVSLGQLLAADPALQELEPPEPVGREFIAFYEFSGERVRFLAQLVGSLHTPYRRAKAVRDTVRRVVETAEACTDETRDGKPIAAAPIWLVYSGGKVLKGCLITVGPVMEDANASVLVQMTVFNARLYSERISSRFGLWQERSMWQAIEHQFTARGERLAGVLDNIGAGMVMLDRDLNVVWHNASASALGCPNGVGRKCYEATYNRDRPCTDCLAIEVMRTGLPSSGIKMARFPALDNQLQHLRMTAIPVVAEDGTVTNVIEIIYDYTRQQIAESELVRYKRLVNNSQDFMLIGDKYGTVIAINHRIVAGLGYQESDLVGQNGSCLIPEHEKVRALALVQNALRMGLAMGDVHLQKKDGSLVATQATISYDREAEVYEAIFRDVSDRLLMEEQIRMRSEQLHAQNREVQAALEERTRFFRHVSHELRTPITSVVGFAELLLDDPEEPPSPAQKHALQRIVGNAHKLLGLVNDLLDLAKLEAKGSEMRVSRVDLAAFLQGVLDNMGLLAEDKNLELRLDLASDLPEICVDEQKLSQIMVNLIANAIKYTVEGSVTVRAARNGSFVNLTVRDTGVGIPSDELTNIFREFYQVGAQDSDVRGSGLGLSIVKKTTAVLGGRLSVKSKVGVGSTFTVRLPLNPNPS